MDVKCPGCKHIYHETTDTFDNNAVPHGHMFRLKPEFARFGEFRGNCSPGDLCCPMCESHYLNARNRVSILVPVAECDVKQKRRRKCKDGSCRD